MNKEKNLLLYELSNDKTEMENSLMVKESEVTDVATPSIENIVLEYQRNEELSKFNSKFITNFQ